MEIPRCFMCNPDNFIGKHKTLNVLPNGFPITSIHLLLVTAEHRGDLRENDLQSAVDFSLTHPQYLVFHNMRGSGATRPEHLHFQAILRDEPLPIEVVPRRELFSLFGTAVFRVENHAVYSVAIRGERVTGVAFAILENLQPTPFNLLLSNGEIIIVPRTKEQPSGFNNLFGGLEMAGCVVLAEEDRYRRLTYEEVKQALSECGFSEEQQSLFEEKFGKHFLLRENEGSGDHRE